MGIFSPRQSAYTPPFDGTKPGSTLVGGGLDKSPPGESEEQLAAQLGTTDLPAPAEGNWTVQLRDYPVTGHRSHAVLVLVGPDGKTTKAELNGLSNSRNFGKNDLGRDEFYNPQAVGADGSKLIVRSFDRQTRLGKESVRALDVASGS